MSMIKDQFRGRWAGALISIGFDESILSGRHGDCIRCGDKRRHARWHIQKEYWVCSKCGITQPIELAMEWLGKNFKETAKLLRHKLGYSKMTVIQQPDMSANEARIKKIHAGLTRITPETTAFLYLAKRGISVLPEANLYAHPGLDYWETSGEKPVKVGTFACMVGVFRTLDMETSSYHITYLNDDGTKANVESVKKILPSIKPLPGSAIKLFVDGGNLAVCEGIETAMAVTKMTDVPCWACGNTSLLEKVQIPNTVKHVIIVADSDKSFAGQRSAYILANRLVSEGFDVTVKLFIDCEQVTDTGIKFDALDFAIANG